MAAIHYARAQVIAQRLDGGSIERFGSNAILFGLALVFLWIGGMKFTAYEAGAIKGLIASSPLLSWLYGILDVRSVANLIGTAEVATGILLLLRPWNAVAGAIGGLMAAATTAVTLTFLFSAPGWEASLGGFPYLSVVPGQFLLKDVVLFGAGVTIFGGALKEIRDLR